MKSLIQNRMIAKISQRKLAKKAGISYKSLQLIEAGGHDPKVSTLSKISEAINYPKEIFNKYLSYFFTLPQDSIAIISRQIFHSKTKDWKIPLFNFVDQFRRTQNPNYVAEPPCEGLPLKIRALIASTTEKLCHELKLPIPWWCAGIPTLAKPFFVSEIENLKASSILESPVEFRKRNIFVMSNFLERA